MTDTSTHTIPFHIVAMIGTAAGGPAVDVKDKRVRAVFAMAPGLIQVFGMDEAAPEQRPSSIRTPFVMPGLGLGIHEFACADAEIAEERAILYL